MFITQPPISPSILASRVVIDWSNLLRSDRSTGEDQEMERLIGWVRHCPERSNVHVYLGNQSRDRSVRRLQSRLQALGCTVTVRSAMTRIQQSETVPSNDAWNTDFGISRTLSAEHDPKLVTIR